MLLFSLPVKCTTCILQFPKVLACSVWPPLINTQRSKEVSGRGLHTNLVPLEETEYLLHSCVIWQALHPDQGSRLGQDGSVGGSGSSCHSSWGSCNVPHRGRRYWRAEREREEAKLLQKPIAGSTTQNRQSEIENLDLKNNPNTTGKQRVLMWIVLRTFLISLQGLMIYF